MNHANLCTEVYDFSNNIAYEFDYGAFFGTAAFYGLMGAGAGVGAAFNFLIIKNLVMGDNSLKESALSPIPYLTGVTISTLGYWYYYGLLDCRARRFYRSRYIGLTFQQALVEMAQKVNLPIDPESAAYVSTHQDPAREYALQNILEDPVRFPDLPDLKDPISFDFFRYPVEIGFRDPTERSVTRDLASLLNQLSYGSSYISRRFSDKHGLWHWPDDVVSLRFDHDAYAKLEEMINISHAEVGAGAGVGAAPSVRYRGAGGPGDFPPAGGAGGPGGW